MERKIRGMDRLNIYLADGSFDGAVIMSSTASQFSTVRVSKTSVGEYETDLGYPGVYLLLIGNDTVYVGETGMDTIANRIMSKHSGTIDSSWHTVLAFCCMNKTVSKNEYLFMENAMTEYAHKNFPVCATTNPAKSLCNAAYRNTHYGLAAGSIHSCNQYLKDIKYYLSLFGDSVFPANAVIIPPAPSPILPVVPVTVPDSISKQVAIFHFASPAQDSDGKAEIQIHMGHAGMRPAVLKAGSRISVKVSTSFAGSNTVLTKRAQLEAEGKIVDRVLQEDVVFSSQSGAGQFLNGTSFDGNGRWKLPDGTPLKKLLI